MVCDLVKLYKKTRQEGDCHIWIGAIAATGEPRINKEAWGRSYARQWAYSTLGGEIKEGHTLYTKCKNKLCVTPQHQTYEPDRSGLLQEFMNQVHKEGGLSPDTTKAHLGNCWWWTGCSSKERAVLNTEKWGEQIGARWIYQKANSIALPSNITVNHLCNNSICVNPSHLSHTVETVWNQANLQQAINEGRLHNQVFTPPQVKALRVRILAGEKTLALAREFNCSKDTIIKIKFNRSFYDSSYTPPT